MKHLMRLSAESLTESLRDLTQTEGSGIPLDYSANASFPQGPDQPVAIGADFSRVLIGLRQDVTVILHTDGVISDSSGKVILNLMQQDSKALRVVVRLAYQVDDTLSAANRNVDAAERMPVVVVKSAPATP